MSKTFLLIAVLSYLSRADCFQFYIARNLESTRSELPKDSWSSVEIQGAVSTLSDDVTLTVSIPHVVDYSDVFVFFANDTKQILGVHLNETVNGNYYEMPHKIVKKLRGGETKTTEKENFSEITADFPRSWLPESVSKVSAAVKTKTGSYYNYYGIQNSGISIADLLVVEEFKKFSPE